MANWELFVSLKNSVGASVWVVTTISEYWEKSCNGPHQHPLQCARTTAFVARCKTFSELTELKLLSENVAWFSDSKSYKSFISTFQLLP